jgi:PAS domain S-box-containing protein
LNRDAAADPPRAPLAQVSPPLKGRERALLTGALALAALLGNWLSLPASFGVDFLFGSIAVMLALAWLGTGAGLLAALVGGAYTWLLWGHPYALLTFLAEAAAVGWHRDRARRRGLAPPPLAVSAALYWLLLGVPLALLAHRFVLGLSWTATLLIAVKQAENGILNAALADLVLVAGVLLTRRQSALPLAQVLFGVLLAAMLVPSLLLNAWENRGLKDRLEVAQADRLRLFGELAVRQLMALPPGRVADPTFVEAQLQVMRSALAEHLPAACAPQLRLERGPAPVPETRVPAAWSPLTWVFGRQARPGQVIPTAAPGFSLILPSGHYSSRLAWWHEARYRMAIPVHGIPALDAAYPVDPADSAPQGFSLVMELRAAPLIDQLQGAAARLLVLLLAVALLGLLVAHGLSRRIARPLRELADDSRTLPAAIREDRPWPAPVPGLLAETGDLADAVAEMARSLAANFRALRESELRFRSLFETMAEGVIYRDEQGAITDANPAALRLLGQSPERLFGTGIADLPWQVLREDGSPLPAAEHPAMVALCTGRDPGEAVMGVIAPLTGDTRWLLVHSRPEVRPGESRPFRVFTSFADITRLQQTERRLRAIIEASPHGIVEADPVTRRLLWCSGSMLRLFGYGLAQWEGLRVEDLHPVESLPRVAAEFARMAQGDLATALELPCRRRDGGTFYCKVSPGLMRLGRDSTLVAFFTDVTAERAARRALELSQESLLKAQEIARLGSWEFDIVNDRVSWSPEAFRIFEQDPERFEPSYEGMLTTIHPEDRALLDRVYRESVAKRIPYELEHRLLTPDGRVKWVYERSETDYAADGTPLRSRGTVQDITERRLAEVRLQESEERLASVFENAPIGMALVEPDLRISRVNRALADFLGRTPAALIGMSIAAVTHPDDLGADAAQFTELTAGRRTSYRMAKRYLRPDGSVVWGDLRATLLPSRPGEPPLPLGMVEDITEQRAATQRQQALEAALTRYNLQLEEFADLISLPLPPAEQIGSLLWLGCHRSGVGAAVLVTMDEERGQRVLFAANGDPGNGFTPELSRALVVEALTHLGSPCVLAAERLPAAALSAGLRSCVAMAFTCPRPDGQADTLILSLWGPEPSLDLDGPGRQIIRLIAQRVASIRYQEQVQHDLVQAKGRESIGHLASGIAHDFNNLLGVIDANVYYLEARLGDLAPADPELRQVMEETQSALGQAKVITSGMLSLSRAGGVPLESVDLAPTVAELERILRQVLPAAIDLRVAVAPGTLAWSNGAFLQSALLNLAFNARDAMLDGGVLSIAAQPIHWDGRLPLAVGAVASMDCIALRVSDTGSGIAPSLLTRIFDPLFSTKARQRGHGLGLFMVQEFVTRSGAGLAVESQPGHGTCFSLLLPREAPAVGVIEAPGGPNPVGPPPVPPAPPADGADGAAPAPLSGLRVLVVEDDPRVREAVGRLLTLDGARLGLAEQGQACLELLERDAAFDLVLSDIAMPVLDGIQLYQRLAQGRPELPVILMTGQKDALSALDELSERPTVLRKPLDPAVLRGAILAKTGGRARGGAVVGSS